GIVVLALLVDASNPLPEGDPIQARNAGGQAPTKPGPAPKKQSGEAPGEGGYVQRVPTPAPPKPPEQLPNSGDIVQKIPNPTPPKESAHARIMGGQIQIDDVAASTIPPEVPFEVAGDTPAVVHFPDETRAELDLGTRAVIHKGVGAAHPIIDL